MTSKEHAAAIVRKLEYWIKVGDGPSDILQANLAAAQWYLRLAEKEEVTVHEIDALLTHLHERGEGAGSGSAWEDIRLGVEGMKRKLQGDEELVNEEGSLPSLWEKLRQKIISLSGFRTKS